MRRKVQDSIIILGCIITFSKSHFSLIRQQNLVRILGGSMTGQAWRLSYWGGLEHESLQEFTPMHLLTERLCIHPCSHHDKIVNLSLSTVSFTPIFKHSLSLHSFRNHRSIKKSFLTTDLSP